MSFDNSSVDAAPSRKAGGKSQSMSTIDRSILGGENGRAGANRDREKIIKCSFFS